MGLVAPTDAQYKVAVSVVQKLQNAGFETYLAGGCVRDLLMKRPVRDYDIATAARPTDIRRLFANVSETGAAFAVSRVVESDTEIEIATFRVDEGSRNGRHPCAVRYATAREDALRRDFTVNGMFYDPIANRLLDFVNGRTDLEQKIIRAIGDPQQRFREDYLRMLRAVRFAAVLEFEIATDTFSAIRNQASQILHISAERIRDELTALLTESPRAGRGLQLLWESGLLTDILPEIAAMKGVEQPSAYHPEGDVFAHTVRMLNAMPVPRSVELAYSVLLHDVGKPATATTRVQEDLSGSKNFSSRSVPFFPQHAERGAEIAEMMLRRLRLPNRVIGIVVHCVRNHMRFMHAREMRLSKLRAMVAHPAFPIELELHRLDCMASHGNLDVYDFLRTFVDRWKREQALPKAWITGHDIMALGIPEGPEVGRWLRKAYEMQLEGRYPNRDAMMEWLKTELSGKVGRPDTTPQNAAPKDRG